MMEKDTYRHQGMRRLLVESLRKKGIKDEVVLEAVSKVPRHLFMDSAFTEFAYEDRAFPIAAGQTISQPFTVAFQTSLLKVESGMKVLEIGTGSGYQAAVLCELGVKLFSIERQKTLYKVTKPKLKEMGYKGTYIYGDGFSGLPMDAPFQRILVTCGAPFIPDALLEQLAIGGRLVIPLDRGDVQEMLLIEKDASGGLQRSSHGTFRFVPMLERRN